MAAAPAMMMSSDSTDAKIGRSMKNRDSMVIPEST
jgi:hypothetical protein